MTGREPARTARQDPHALAALCVELAQGAAAQVSAGRRADMTVGTKSVVTDLVTDVDRATEAWLRDRLREARPHDGVLGEESGEHPGGPGGRTSSASEVRWVLDPIDGTVNFVLGLPYYAVSVAAEVSGVVVAAAVANPVTGEIFRARRGGGAFLGEQRLLGPRGVEQPAAVVATGFAYDPHVRTRQIAVVGQLMPDIGDIRRMGAASVDLCSLAAGRVDAYFEAGLHEWDHAAGALIAAEAGCLVTGLRGRKPGRAMVAAAPPDLAATLFADLERLGADQVTG